MSIKAVLPVGNSEAVADKLHQWDYGQQLEIESRDLPTLIEVHFACQGMTDAEVRSCNAVDGVATVTIPDRCLEQTSNITAWVYEIKGTTGTTIKTITIPVIARTRPGKKETVPDIIYDKYTELVTEINEAVDALTDGKVTAANAVNATNAANATKAVTAINANHATNAENAETAGTINKYLHSVHLVGTVNGESSEITFQFVCNNSASFKDMTSLVTTLVSLGFGSFHTLPTGGFVYWFDDSNTKVHCILYGIQPTRDHLMFVAYDYTNHRKVLTGGQSISSYTISSDVVVTL